MPEPRPSTSGLRLLDRRAFLARTFDGLSSIAAAALLAEDRLLAADGPRRPVIDPARPHAPRPPHFEPRATNVLVIFCAGALSHVDTFDYKPELIRFDGRPMPGNERLVSFQGENGNLKAPLWPFRPRGQCGKMTSDLLPHLGELADELCFVHSLTTKSNTHGPGENVMSTGFTTEGFPAMGAWITYALGSENRDLPAFVAIEDPRGMPQSGPNNWANGFLPAAFQGTPFSSSKPIRHLSRPAGVSAEADADALDALRSLNARHAEHHPGDQSLAARVAGYELAARMQLSVPEAAAIDAEPEHVLRLYGADHPDPVRSGFARNCILARRLLERGVRFVQLFNGAYASGGRLNWDGHSQLKEQYEEHAAVLDRPVAGLLRDLKRRGLLDSTLVLFCTEFGRMPMFQLGTYGRDHNPFGFTCWLAGAGVRAGTSFGATDPFGFKAEQDVLTVHDLHATVLHALGLDHEALTYYHNGIERRLTDVAGNVIPALLS
ncbi:DUF1501 domain-containing protein [Tautonia sociabilis]|uniref:DUF1501 domain-containing protein n=1 Tax=Tautonia sociabilis TaxID=2080755 RepID=A0A432MFK0_9BACT|nr:DUF1501 domain-containing protein [Tautonia sociabilis]RUL84683.1 DUF1501 domain-containing protein [Tautonia sociabilis]